MSSNPKFYVPVDLKRTALLVSDVQSQILSRFPEPEQTAYLERVQRLLDLFRAEIKKAHKERNQTSESSFAPTSLYDNCPLIIHHVLPFGLNSNAFISPYNKLASWVRSLEAQGFFKDTTKTDPNTPQYAIPPSMAPPSGWGTKDEIIIPKIQAGSFSSSDLLAYLRARDIKHVVLIGLTTMGSILGGARLGSDLDFHIIIPRDAVMDDNAEVNDFLLAKVLPRFTDVVDVDDVLGLPLL
ncbi:isochorismatase hydrolase-1 [Coleophoma crateriformis]|uniref:Isochorismatase hydrolase-1 n=1 Tax=Coleophoma crateriformis TaxID=565419 RepID=A0A3D8Q9Y2_9HELO|nr:isochorismatase hydrolase-1 [Coleophoma crateriformis]